MKLEPQTFFIGVIDFFSVLLPGAVIVALFQEAASAVPFPSVFPKYSGEAAGWAIFLFASYLAGHFIFLLGSQIDRLYERLRGATDVSVARTKEPWPLTRRLARMLLPKASELAVTEVLKLKEKIIPDVNGEPVINAFQWSKARLMIQCPAALSDVQRLEADSKFFRSFFVVLMLLALWLSAQTLLGKLEYWALALGCVVLAVLSFWRYAERRFKSVEQAYWYVITLEHCAPAKMPTKRHASPS